MFRISVKIVHGSVQVKVVRRTVEMYELCELKLKLKLYAEQCKCTSCVSCACRIDGRAKQGAQSLRSVPKETLLR